MGVAIRESRFRTFVAVSVVVAGFLGYLNTFTNEFVWDDASSILLHKHVQAPGQFFDLFREDQHAFGRGQGNFYRPLVAASFMVDFALSRAGPGLERPGKRVPAVSPFLFHLTNTAWHVAAALLVFALLRRVDAPRCIQGAVPFIFVLHPLHTEAVAYISGRADPMAATFMLASLWFALWEDSFGKRCAGAVLAPLCFAAALLCKESAAIFPGLLLLLTAAAPVRAGYGAARTTYFTRLIPFAVSVLVLFVYAYLRLTKLAFGPESGPPAVALGQRLVEAGQAFALYLRLLFVPTGLHMERTLEGVPTWVSLAGAGLLVLCLMLMAAGVRRKEHRLVIAMGWFLITWFPISGIAPLNAPMAEHWMYLPMIGLFWALAEWLHPKLTRPILQRAAVAGVFLVCVVFLGLTVARNRDWRDNETLFLATLEKNPRSARVHYNLAVTYEDLLGNLPDARRHYEEALVLYGEQRGRAAHVSGAALLSEPELEAHLSLGNINLEQHLYEEAIDHYTIVQAAPADTRLGALRATAAFGIGKCLLATGDSQGASQYFDQALVGRPDLTTEIERLAPDSGPSMEF